MKRTVKELSDFMSKLPPEWDVDTDDFGIMFISDGSRVEAFFDVVSGSDMVVVAMGEYHDRESKETKSYSGEKG